jgi:NAD(P)-dependent dehydrogenase (short-subunit alcohol dehydrogenase family)
VALVSGATGGFGSVAARALAAGGAKVMATGTSLVKLQAVFNQIREDGGQVHYSAADISNYEDVKRVVQETVEAFGGIDILLAAAGINKVKAIVEQPLEDWEKVIDINLKGAYYLCKEVGKVMIAQGRGGKVVLLGSARGDLGMANYTAYSPSKAAVHLLTKSLGCEWGPHKINVNAIAPTVFRTTLTQWMFDDQAFYKNFLRRIPIGRLGEPEDFIGSLIFLCSKASDFLTGAVIPADGGYSAG